MHPRIIASVSTVMLLGTVAACGREGTTAGAITASETSTDPVTAQGQSQTLVSAAVGQEVDIRLGTVGPGNFDAPPAISSDIVHFLDAKDVGPYVPAGEQQQFRFAASDTGVAIITFHHAGQAGLPDRVVIDTIHVH